MKKGFTLLELLVVILLIGLLATLVLPRIVAFLPKGNVFLVEAANFIEGARARALMRHEAVMVVFDAKKRTLTLKGLANGEMKDLGKGMSIPEEIEIKAEGLVELPDGCWGILFLANGASTGGSVEIIDRVAERRLTCRLARSQFLVEVIPE